MLPVPSKDTPPMFLAVSKAVVVAALPVVLAFIVAGKLIVIVPALSKTVTSFAVPAKVNVPPKATGLVFGVLSLSETVIDEFASFAFAIDPANSSLLTPLSFIVTAPDVTEKLSEEKLATPLLDVLASSPAIVSVVPVADVSIPSPPRS